jgi:hypothetical protein
VSRCPFHQTFNSRKSLILNFGLPNLCLPAD